MCNLRAKKFVFSTPPSVNKIYRRNSNGVFLSREAKAWKEEMIFRNKRFVGDGFGKSLLKVLMYYFPSSSRDEKVRDIDNLLKISLDTLQEIGCFDNDNQICDLRIRRFHCSPPGCLSIFIKTVNSIPNMDIKDIENAKYIDEF